MKEVAQQFKFDPIIVLDNKLKSYNCKSILVLKQDIMENPTGHIIYLGRLVFKERTIVVGGDSRESKEFMRLFQNH